VARILIAEDDPLVSSFIERGLRSTGHTTVVVDSGERAAAYALSDEFDLLILDLGLPERDGFDVLQEIRGSGSRVSILVLTGRRERDVVMCLEGGADDFMTKPFRFEELLARVRARLRMPGTEESSVLTVGDMRLDLRSRRASIEGREVSLTGREFALLEVLMRHPGQILTREQLLSDIWGYYFDPGTNVLNVFVLSLRRKLGDDVIETVRGLGYRIRNG
jgi:DNA-binding response OmpR family regulator